MNTKSLLILLTALCAAAVGPCASLDAGEDLAARLLYEKEILERLHAAKVTKLSDGRHELVYDFSDASQMDDWYRINDDGNWKISGGNQGIS